MKIFALADPHLSLSTPGKEMDRFGDKWIQHAETICKNCQEVVGEDDILLLPGDLSWAIKMETAQTDLDFLGALPGRKAIIRGNHDYWWQGIGKVRAALPDRMLALHGDAAAIDSVHLCGTRLWDVPGVSFEDWIDWIPESEGGISRPPRGPEEVAQAEKIYLREKGRLERAIEAMQRLKPEPALRIVLVHYPPCSPDLSPNELTAMFEAANVNHVVFGHVHSLRTDRDEPFFGELNGVSYHMTACDFLDFKPALIAEL